MLLLLLFMSTAAAAATAVVVVAVDVGAAAAAATGYLGVVGDTSWKQGQLGSCWFPSFWKVIGGGDDGDGDDDER